MRAWRSQIRLLGSFAALSFALVAGTPRLGLLTHTHAGGDHAHVHVDAPQPFQWTAEADDEDLPFASNDYEIDLSPAPAARPLATPLAWQRHPHHSSSHSHWQEAFHLATLSAASVVWSVSAVEPLSLQHLAAPLVGLQQRAAARAPPASPFV